MIDKLDDKPQNCCASRSVWDWFAQAFIDGGVDLVSPEDAAVWNIDRVNHLVHFGIRVRQSFGCFFI